MLMGAEKGMTYSITQSVPELRKSYLNMIRVMKSHNFLFISSLIDTFTKDNNKNFFKHGHVNYCKLVYIATKSRLHFTITYQLKAIQHSSKNFSLFKSPNY